MGYMIPDSSGKHVGRRSLVVGGGAAALAALTGAVAPARAFGGASTASEHARQVVEWIDVDRGLPDLDVVKNRLVQGLAELDASPPRDPRANDLHAWMQQRVTDLTGKTEAYPVVAYHDPLARALLAFFFAVHSQHMNPVPPTITESMPVHPVLARLESDFFPALVAEVDAEGRRSAAFAELMNTSDTEMERIITEIADTPTAGGGAAPAAIKDWKRAMRIVQVAIVVIGALEYALDRKMN